MNIDISKAFLHPEEDIPFEISLPLGEQTVFGEKIAFDPVTVKGTFRLTGEDTVIAEGEMETIAHGKCALCLSPVQTGIHFSFREIFVKDGQDTEEDTFPYHNKELPMDQPVLTLCMLHLPMRFVCEGGCSEEESIQSLLGHEEDKPHPEEEEQSTYYPFAGLGEMLQNHSH